MTVRPDGGGGGVVLIDPDSLRQAAGKLKGVSGELSSLVGSLGEDAFPTMPPGVAAAVQGAIAEAVGGICTQPATLDDTCVELTRRAFWAQYADSMMGGYTLSGPARQEFLSYLRDGSLLRYATPEEAVAAGMELALVSQNFRHGQRQLFQLAAALQGVVRSGIPAAELRAFSAGFVNRFGAKNMELVPRVIQAMEWSRAIAFGQSTDPNLLRDVARQWSDQKLQTNPVKDLLAPFSICLANATLSGQLTRTVEDGIADGEDTWSTAMLLSQGDRFETDFLVECFRTGVVKKIADDSRYYGPQDVGGEPPPGDEYALGQMWSDGKEHVPFDTKQIVLDALARNPAAAAQALTQTFPKVQVFDGMGNRVEVSDPMQLLYRYGHFDDHGAAFGRAYIAGADSLRLDGNALGEDRLTLAVADQVVNGGRDDLGGVTDGLATTLANHHLADLHWAAAANGVEDPDGGALGWVDPTQDTRIHLTQGQLVDVLSKVTDRGDASARFLAAAARYQAGQIETGTAVVPTATGDFSWAHRAGAFDSALMQAGDMNRLQDFQHAAERQKLIVGFLNDVSKLVDVNPVAGLVIDHGIDAVSNQLAPSADQLTSQNQVAHAVIQNSLAAAIAKGYADHGHIDLADAKHYGLVGGDGKLMNYGDLDPLERSRFEEWLGNDSSVNRMLHEALQDAWRP